MRNLTIKREKTFVASLVTMKVYIEDPSSNEIMINNTPCRKLGVLKNGEEKTFSIDESAAKVFVIADKLSKGYCSEFYSIPEGEEDVFLSGKNKFNPASGNAFRFHGVTDEEVLKNRKKGTKKGVVILVIALILGLIAGYFVGTAMTRPPEVEPQTFSSNGMEITLTNHFSEITVDGYTVCYESNDTVILALKEEFALAEGFGDLTLEEYGGLIISGNNFEDSTKLLNEDGLVYFEYQFTNPETNETYDYFTVVYKSSDAFWMVQFVTLDEYYEQCKPSIIQWAQSVEFTN